MQTIKILFPLLVLLLISCQSKQIEYVCKPCDLPCDTLRFWSPGICPHCKMELLEKNKVLQEANLQVNEINISEGSGVFLIEGGEGNTANTIRVFYHQPQQYNPDSKILIVIPGAGRNGGSYRDAWIEESETYGFLVLSPMYSEDYYSFEDYHMAGLIDSSNIQTAVEFVENSNIAKLNEDSFEFSINENRKEWIFNDFDRLFDLVVDASGSNQKQYDLFGHSAGGQILHRMAIFHPDSKANKIIAANSGFYTLPETETPLPFGIQELSINKEHLTASFSKKLIILVGALDNENEQGGTLLRSPTADLQGFHRLERGNYFYNRSKEIAKSMQANFNWEIVVVPDVGHDHRGMGDATAKLMFEK